MHASKCTYPHCGQLGKYRGRIISYFVSINICTLTIIMANLSNVSFSVIYRIKFLAVVHLILSGTGY